MFGKFWLTEGGKDYYAWLVATKTPLKSKHYVSIKTVMAEKCSMNKNIKI